MLQSLSRGNSSVGQHASGTSTPITKQVSRQYSSQENEVPQSNYHERSPMPSSGQITPYGSDATDPVSLAEVDALLRIVRNGGDPLRV